MTQPIKNWEERFDDNFVVRGVGDTGFCHDRMAKELYANPRTIKSFISQLLSEATREAVEIEKGRVVAEIKKFKIMEGSVIDRLEEKTERERMTNLLNENLEIGYRQACMDIIKLLKDPITNPKQ